MLASPIANPRFMVPSFAASAAAEVRATGVPATSGGNPRDFRAWRRERNALRVVAGATLGLVAMG
jgi:hypothetical protein